MKQLKRFKEWMDWQAIQVKDLIVISIAFIMLGAVSAFGVYAVAILIAAELSP